MGALNSYLMRVQQLIGFDEHQTLYNPDDLIPFINTARDEVAAQGQCLRATPPTSGSVLALHIVTSGSGYTSPTLTIGPPDLPNSEAPFPNGLRATGIVSIIGGQISSASVTLGGSGYYARPSVVVSDPTGTGAVVTAEVSPVTTTNVGQETYYFSDLDLSGAPGYRAVLAVLSISIIWGAYQWSCIHCSFSKYQAIVRQYTTNYLAPPTVMAQFGQGTSGSFKLYPIPDQAYPMTWDCLCLPSELTDDTSPEAIPEPWTKAVPYYAAHLALLSKAAIVPALVPLANQYFNEKTGGLFGVMMRRSRAFSQPGYRVSSFYGRGF